MSAEKLKEFLHDNHVRYVTVPHAQAFTAQETAQAAHVPGSHFAKTVVFKADGRMCLAVLPADYHIDLASLRRAAGAREISLVEERDFRPLFPDCEAGAMPPFGNLYDMEVYAADELAHDEEIAFNAGNHEELIRMAYRDFAALVRPRVAHFSLHG